MREYYVLRIYGKVYKPMQNNETMATPNAVLEFNRACTKVGDALAAKLNDMTEDGKHLTNAEVKVVLASVDEFNKTCNSLLNMLSPSERDFVLMEQGKPAIMSAPIEVHNVTYEFGPPVVRSRSVGFRYYCGFPSPKDN